MKKERIVVNLIGGPGTGKSLYASHLFSLLKMKGKNTEYVQEYAKNLVRDKKTELLRNQHHISYFQYKRLKKAAKHVDFIITDGSLVHNYYYNRYNKPTYSNIELTEERIDAYYNSFKNINIFLKRNDKYEYETEGRYQTKEEAIKIDDIMKDIMEEKGINYKTIVADFDNIDKMSDYILENI